MTSLIHCGRHLRHLGRDRALLTNTLVLPALSGLVMVALFKELMRAAQGGNLSYLPIAIMLVISGQAMNCQASAADLVRERSAGLVDRVRTTPGGEGPYVRGIALAVWLRLVLAGVAVIAAMAVIGLRASAAAWLWLLLITAVGAAFATAVAIAMAAISSTPEETMAITPLFMTVLFLSAGLVPTDNFVPAVRPFVRNNPITHAVRAGLELDGAGADLGAAGHDIWLTLAWFIGLTMAAGILAFTRRGSARS